MMMVVMAVCREIHRGDQFIEVVSIVHLRFYIVKSILHHQSSLCKRTAYFSKYVLQESVIKTLLTTKKPGTDPQVYSENGRRSIRAFNESS